MTTDLITRKDDRLVAENSGETSAYRHKKLLSNETLDLIDGSTKLIIQGCTIDGYALRTIDVHVMSGADAFRFAGPIIVLLRSDEEIGHIGLLGF